MNDEVERGPQRGIPSGLRRLGGRQGQDIRGNTSESSVASLESDANSQLEPAGSDSTGDVGLNMIGGDRRVGRPHRRVLDPAARVCVWPGVHISLQRLWLQLERDCLPRELHRLIKVVRVKQRQQSRFGAYRFDFYLVNLCRRSVKWVFRYARQQGWYARVHEHFHAREARLRQRQAGVAPVHVQGCPTKLRLATLNVGTMVGRRPDVQDYLWSGHLDILALQETQRHAVTGWPLRFRHFQSYESPMTDGPSARGVALLVSLEVPSYEIGVPSPYYVGVQLSVGEVDWVVASVYIPPVGSPGGARRLALQQVKRFVQVAIGRDLGARVLLLGDFNMHPEKLDRLLTRWGLPLSRLRVQGSPLTFHRFRHGVLVRSALDHVVCSAEALLSMTPGVVDRTCDLSDHWPLHAVANGHQLVDDPMQRVPCPRMDLKVLRQQCEVVSLHNSFAVLADEADEFLGDGNALGLGSFAQAFQECAQGVVEEVGGLRPIPPRGKVRDGQHLYKLSPAAKRAIRKRRKVYAQWLQQPQPQENDALWAQYLVAKVTARNLQKESMQESWQSLLRLGSEHLREGDLAEFWAWTNRLTGRKKRSLQSPPLFEHGSAEVVLYRPQEKLAALHRFYSNLFGDSVGFSKDVGYWVRQYVHIPELEELPHMNAPILWDEVNQVLRSLRGHKAAGLDGIPPEFFKLAQEDPRSPGYLVHEAQSALGRAIHRVCQVLFSGVDILDEDNVSEVVLIFKKGDPRDMGNYRPISLIKVFLKLITKLLIRRVHVGLEARNWFTPAQAGFRRWEEANAHTIALHEILARRRVSGKRTFVAFVDIRKAYDTVPHEAMLRKMFLCGVRGAVLEFFRKLYMNAQVVIRTVDGCTNRIPLLRGLRQGCPASPDEFNIFVNDILDGCAGNGVHLDGIEGEIVGLLFADDLALLAPTVRKLRQSLGAIQAWAACNHMAFGVDKCGLMGVAKADEPVDAAQVKLRNSQGLELEGEPLAVVDSYPYLGLPFHYTLGHSAMVTDRARKGQSALQALRPMLQSSSIPLALRLRVMKAVLVPTLTYGSELWGFPQVVVAPVQRVLDQAARVLFGVRIGNRQVTSKVLLLELGLLPLTVTAISSRVRAFVKYRILKTIVSSLVLTPQRNVGVDSWVNRTIRLLQRTCWPWENRLQHLCPIVVDYYVRRWVAAPAATLRRYVAGNFEATRAYLELANGYPAEASGIQQLARWRVGLVWTAPQLVIIHYLDGEWTIRCPMCLGRVAETMYHILFQCPRWGDFRVQLMGDEGFPLFRLPEEQRVTTLLGGSGVSVRRHPIVRDWLRRWLELPPPAVDDEGPGGPQEFRERELPTFVRVARYLSQVQRERIRVLSPLIDAARANAGGPPGPGRAQLNAEALVLDGG